MRSFCPHRELRAPHAQARHRVHPRAVQHLQDSNGEWYAIDPVYTVKPLTAEEARARITDAVTAKQARIARGIRHNQLALTQLFGASTLAAIRRQLKAMWDEQRSKRRKKNPRRI